MRDERWAACLLAVVAQLANPWDITQSKGRLAPHRGALTAHPTCTPGVGPFLFGAFLRNTMPHVRHLLLLLLVLLVLLLLKSLLHMLTLRRAVTTSGTPPSPSPSAPPPAAAADVPATPPPCCCSSA